MIRSISVIKPDQIAFGHVRAAAMFVSRVVWLTIERGAGGTPPPLNVDVDADATDAAADAGAYRTRARRPPKGANTGPPAIRSPTRGQQNP